MKKNKLILILPILVIIITSILLINGSSSSDNTLALVSDINYKESLRELNNPERGFYEPIGINMQEEDNKVLNPKNNLVHLRVGIGAFSAAVNGDKDKKFTTNMLESLDQTLKNIKNNGGAVIIRFAYDNFNGTKDLEPSMSMLLTHIRQLEPLFKDNESVIAYVELGFFGPWGEMHSSKICTNENVNEALKAMLSVVPKNIKIGVRTPGYYASFAGINRDDLKDNKPKENEDTYRIGLYNDGYLGSESDLGTFKNRDIEVSWLTNQAKHTFYGGEVVANYANSTPLNTIDYISKEGFLTHTTYLNLRWNNTVIDNWKNTTYNGEDELYKGSSGFLYVNNHLGYRFVLTSSNISNNITSDSKLEGKLNIKNVGFANLINKKVASIIITNGNNTYEIKTDIDVRTWESTKDNTVDFSIPLPNDIELGEWTVYLRLSEYGDYLTDNNYKCIEFANDDIYSKTLGANYIGTVNIVKPTTTTSLSTSTSTTTISIKPTTSKTSTKSTTTSTSKITTTTTPITSTTSTTTTKVVTTTKPNITTTTTTSNDILYVEPSDSSESIDIIKTTTSVTTTNTTTTTKIVTTSNVNTTTKLITTTSKTTKASTTTKKTSKKTTTKKSPSTTTSQPTTISESKDEEVIIKQGNTRNLRGIIVIFFTILVICLILINHYKI